MTIDEYLRALSQGPRRGALSKRSIVVRVAALILLGTAFAFLLSAAYAKVQPAENLVVAVFKSSLPVLALPEFVIALAALVVIGLLTLVGRIWRSLRLGLNPFSDFVWVFGVVSFWLLLPAHHLLAVSSVLASLALNSIGVAIGRGKEPGQLKGLEGTEPDLPLPEDGHDLLGRMDIVDGLVSKIVYEQPMTIAVTGPYGDGKTSLLNLTVGALKSLNERERPIIVKFSPWLASDSNTLILSLLNSIVAEIEKSYVIPGLKRDASQYALTALSFVPKADRLMALFGEPSQDERITTLANRVATTGRRVLVILDDLDRLQAEELETVFKLLRGSETLSTVTFLCSFAPKELQAILKKTRGDQDIVTFVEKFFQLEVPLARMEPFQLENFFLQKLSEILKRRGIPYESLIKSLSDDWDDGLGPYFSNLRRIKLFLNKIGNSLARIAGEVNTSDFLRLELLHDAAPSVYDAIYRDPQFFYERDWAFEVRYKGHAFLDDKQAAKLRDGFYEKLLIPLESGHRLYVENLLQDLFPNFRQYKKGYAGRSISGAEAERGKRIFHPRFFRQYFLLKVPSELFSEKDFTAFEAALKRGGEDHAAQAFTKTFVPLEAHDFKRWHFMHKIDSAFETFSPDVIRGLCRGMARNSTWWPADAFELQIAVRCTKNALSRLPQKHDRQSLLRQIIDEANSDQYVTRLLWVLEDGASPEILIDLCDSKSLLAARLRQRYLRPDPPSVFIGEFQVNDINAVLFLLGWMRLGAESQNDQREYLLSIT